MMNNEQIIYKIISKIVWLRKILTKIFTFVQYANQMILFLFFYQLGLLIRLPSDFLFNALYKILLYPSFELSKVMVMRLPLRF